MAKCVYCKGEVSSERTMEVCDACGRKIWGQKMFEAIVNGTDKEKEKGNMCLWKIQENEKSSSGEIQEMYKNLENARAIGKKTA